MATEKNPPQRTIRTRRTAKENASPGSGTRWTPCEEAPFKFELDNTPRGEIVAHALRVIRRGAPQEFEAQREALHSALLGKDYKYFGGDPEPGPLDGKLFDLKLVEAAAQSRGLESIKDTFEQLKQAVEAKTRTEQELDWSDRAKEATWKPSQLRKIPGMRAEAKQRLEEGGDPDVEHRVTADLQLEDGWYVPGTVRDSWLANGEPRNRQGPRVRYEESRQILFELTTGTLRLSCDAASMTVEQLLLLYVGEEADWETLRRWWLSHPASRHT